MADAREGRPGIATGPVKAARRRSRWWLYTVPAAALAILLAFAVSAELRLRRRVEAVETLKTLGCVQLGVSRPVSWPWRLVGAFTASDPRVVSVQLEGGAATDDALALAARLDEIEFLEARGDGVTDAGLARLSGLRGLRRLKLDRTSVTDAGLAHLAGLKSLARLDLTDTAVTAEGVAMLERRLPYTQILWK